MGSFLDHYEGSVRVALHGEYYVELWEHASEASLEEADRALSQMHIVDGVPDIDADMVRYRQLVILAHLKEWNLDDDGVLWPYSLASVKRLPKRVFNQLWAITDKLDAPEKTEDRKRFPDEGSGSDQGGDTGTADAREVPVRAATRRKAQH